MWESKLRNVFYIHFMRSVKSLIAQTKCQQTIVIPNEERNLICAYEMSHTVQL